VPYSATSQPITGAFFHTVISSHGHLITSKHYMKPPAVIIHMPVR